jgi:hypothetical protein
MDAIILITVLIGLYFLPSIVAGARKVQHGSAILVLNILLGWTLLGWVGALIWALADAPMTPIPLVAPSERVPCPFCAEAILPEAKVCPFCRHDLPERWAPAPRRTMGPLPRGMVICSHCGSATEPGRPCWRCGNDIAA